MTAGRTELPSARRAAQIAQTPTAGARFHHLHLRVVDPAAAMATYVRANGCTEIILQGLGVGVQCGSGYLLFDRNDRPAEGPVVRAEVSVSGSGNAASIHARLAAGDPVAVRSWIRDRLGLAAPAALTFVDRKAEGTLPDEISHIAFSIADPAPLVTRLSASGVTIVSRRDDATLVAGPSGLPIEIVRDAPSGPDAYWCPMHPNVRAPRAGTCPLCGMALVPIPPPVFGDYRMRVDIARVGAGRQRLTIRISDPASGRLVTSFVKVHERVLHVFIVSRDLEYFEHVHPQAAPDGSFTLDLALPGPAAYALYADFYPTGGTPQFLQTSLATPDYRGSAFPDPPALRPTGATPQRAGSLRGTLATGPLIAGQDATLTFTLADDRSGAPVTDLQPYLGAAGHLLIASADLVDAIHTHPSDMKATGPVVTFNATLPRPGLYKLWVQFQRAGQVVTLPFVVEVR